MESDLRKLIDDRQFREFHREFVEPREFNTFDVLRYADYEIRHSNVLAWLLRPTDTHGIGDRFLRWFVEQTNRRLVAANEELIPATDFRTTNVVVERELEYVDITIFFKKEKCLLAIENKSVPASSEHIDQVMGYERKLRGKHGGHTVKSVLLTTSPHGSVEFPSIAHIGWNSIHEAIGSFHQNGEFHSGGVEAFIGQYLDLVERWFGPTGGDVLKPLLDKHRTVLKEMRQIHARDGDDGVGGMVPEDRADYRDSLVRLVKESSQNPKQLRMVVAHYLKGQGCRIWPSHNPKLTHYWLSWTDSNLAETARSLSGKDDFLRWELEFTYRDVGVRFNLYQHPREDREEYSPLDRIKGFMRTTPINRDDPDRFRMEDAGFGWYRVYNQELLSGDELAEMSGSQRKDEVLRILNEFLASDESDYRRINDYFRCLAFRPDGSESRRENSP